MKMSFGKHRGVEIVDLPDEYIAWLIDDCKQCRMRPMLHEAVMEEYWHRVHPRPAIRFDADQTQLMKRLLVAGYRALALTEHPDRGGDTRKMQELNRLMDDIDEQFHKAA